MATLATPYVHPFGDAVVVDHGQVRVVNEAPLASDRMDQLVRDAVFGDAATQAWARWLIWEVGQAVGVRASSIHSLYMARGRGLVHGFTVPAINVRGHGLRHRAVDLPDGQATQRRRVHLRDRTLRDRLHRSAAGRVRRR